VEKYKTVRENWLLVDAGYLVTKVVNKITRMLEKRGLKWSDDFDFGWNGELMIKESKWAGVKEDYSGICSSCAVRSF